MMKRETGAWTALIMIIPYTSDHINYILLASDSRLMITMKRETSACRALRRPFSIPWVILSCTEAHHLEERLFVNAKVGLEKPGYRRGGQAHGSDRTWWCKGPTDSYVWLGWWDWARVPGGTIVTFPTSYPSRSLLRMRFPSRPQILSRYFGLFCLLRYDSLL